MIKEDCPYWDVVLQQCTRSRSGDCVPGAWEIDCPRDVVEEWYTEDDLNK